MQETTVGNGFSRDALSVQPYKELGNGVRIVHRVRSYELHDSIEHPARVRAQSGRRAA